MINQIHSTQIGARLSRGRADLFFIAQDCDPSQTLARYTAGGGDRSRVFAFRQDEMLGIRGGALSDLIEYRHRILRFQTSESN